MSYARNQAVAAYGERIAADHLRSAGMDVVDRNWRCRQGEIDIVARDGTTVVVCEVKTRSTDRYGGPVEAVTARKAERLRRLAHAWLEAHDEQPEGLRIDVVSVVVPSRGRAKVTAIRGVA
ncbi:MAG: YraN family protein [Aeromicrobium sp.]|uniref:YraN family protein n=1 Tax=Aeromicrobium sp. TaxID=1871063 RepID=UPI0039E369CE